jgi:hypothetical protein
LAFFDGLAVLLPTPSVERCYSLKRKNKKERKRKRNPYTPTQTGQKVLKNPVE